MPEPAEGEAVRSRLLMVTEILEFRAENFQQLLAPPRRKESDFFFEPFLMACVDAEPERERQDGERSREGKGERIGINTLTAEELKWSSYKGLTVDTLAHRGDEGRGYLR